MLSWNAVSASIACVISISVMGHWHQTAMKGGENLCSSLDFWWAASNRELVMKSLDKDFFSVYDSSQGCGWRQFQCWETWNKIWGG